MKEMSKTKKVIIAVVGILVLIGLALGMLCLYNRSKDKPAEGEKSVTIEVHSDRDRYDFSQVYKTTEEYLGDLLENEGLIGFDKSDYGRFITSVQGYESNDAEQYWWSVAVDGESAMTGIDEIVLTDGSVYTLELKKGW